MRILKHVILWLSIIVVTPFLVVGGIYLNYFYISQVTRDAVYSNTAEIPYRKYTLILGAGDYEPEKWDNPAFNFRMKAAMELYNSGKTAVFLVSGITVTQEYDEPGEMKHYLMKHGIPESNIVSDSLGIRTWLSVLRAKKIFHLDSVTIISQPIHLERALFSAGCIGLDAIGYEAISDPSHQRYWLFRERMARVKSLLDCVAYKLNKH